MEIFKTTILMLSLMVVFIFTGGLIGGKEGMFIAFLIALGSNFFSYFFSDKLILKRYNAIKVDEYNAQGLFKIVKNLCKKANLKIPAIYIIPEKSPNAFATGRNPKHAAVAVTEGLLDLLNEEEIEGVIAHELSHIKHYDILTGSIVAVMAGAIAMIANFAKFGAITNNSKNSNKFLIIVFAIIMPIVASIIQMAISREREYKADKGAALITKKPQHLASALMKLENYANSYRMRNASEQSAHMFIINPFSSMGDKLSQLFRTHPSTNDRIQALRKLQEEIN
ncbi:zinc metalloprotease HtpX [Campylobacter pinnipediorum]|uniref:Protease HtpX homolog n=2 Tax=Campylobacter TaxID=194 RepID=A0AAX0LBC9_9BACT|nr:zinc metalloprotease HtpX [Campylobacter pinnipediorum]AQW83454.1 heat shock protein HtpX, M48 family peptidase [Campylobacter pinnipediorum subsp. pinnipediorum]OPA81569.1 protease [Campylobacter pinnipediorum subsp. pinnipediorum]